MLLAMFFWNCSNACHDNLPIYRRERNISSLNAPRLAFLTFSQIRAEDIIRLHVLIRSEMV